MSAAEGSQGDGQKRKGSKGNRKPGGDGGLSFLTEPLDPESPVAVQSHEVAVVEFESEDPSHDARRNAMIKEAEMRAEHQLAARTTMLDLAQELEDVCKVRRQAEMALLEEKKVSDRLRAQHVATLKKIDEAKKETQEARFKHMRDRMMTGMNEGCLTAAALLWSRIVLPIDRVGEGLKQDQRADLEEYERDDLPDERSEEEISEWPADKSGKLLAIKGQRLRGDGLMLMWMIRGWKSKVEEMRWERLAETKKDDGSAARFAALQAEMEKMKGDYEKKIEGERAKSRGAEERVKALQKEIEKLKWKIEELENRPVYVPVQKKEEVKVEVNNTDELEAKIKELTEVVIPAKDKVIDQRDQSIKGLESTIRKMDAEFEEERKVMKAQLKEVMAEVDRLVIFARHLKESWMKAKRDAAQSVSIDKFSQMIQMLEDMKDRLYWIGRENTDLKGENSHLGRRLDQNKRRLELERQFLPLLHKVRGPVGPKNPLFNKNMGEMAAINMVPDEMGPGGTVGSPPEKLRMAHSQSTGALEPIGKPANRPDVKGGHRLQG